MSNSDVETFEGKIYCNQDGSACVIQDQNDFFVNKRSHKADLDDKISTKCLSNLKVKCSPNVHTFRVVSARDLIKTNHRNNATSIQKPILMCFSCKLSFGNLKSFTSHAKIDHLLQLRESEITLLNDEHSSAIVQNNMDAKPQISFLEPNEEHSDIGQSDYSDSKNNIVVSIKPNLTETDGVEKPEPELREKHESISMDSNTKSTTLRSTILDDNMRYVESNSFLNNTLDNSSTNQLENMKLFLKQSDTIRSLFREETVPTLSNDAEGFPFHHSLSKKSANDLNVYPKESNLSNQASSSLFNLNPTLYNREKVQDENVKFLSNLIQAQIKEEIEPNCEDTDEYELIDSTNNLKSLRSPNTLSKLRSIPVSPTMSSNINSTTNIANSFTIGACTEHINGRPIGLECARCEIILNSARLSNNQLSTRNSCKTLKCPQCNWHYKYQETLEIHMREKHPDGESACAYCLAGQQHPRLARGESYSCGYKPYRCEICNYSTTTKGNLSIHMQSDKHLNNMQDLNSTQTIVAAAIAAGGSLEPVTNKGLHNPETTTKNQEGFSESSPTTKSPNSVMPINNMSTKVKPNFRCDICNYETNVARNLRIHMTSEKHAHNVAVLQNNLKQIHALNLVQQHQLYGSSASTQDPTKPSVNDFSSNNFIPEMAIADLAYSQALMIQMLQQSAAAVAAVTNPLNIQNTQLTNEEKTSNISSSPSPNPLANQSQSQSDTTQLSFINNSGLNNLSEISEYLPIKPEIWPKNVFSCVVCSAFSTDSLEELSHHVQIDRSRTHPGINNDFTVIQNNNYICRLCNYKTNLKANFQLHSKTDKHLQKLSYINHIREGGMANEYKLSFLQSNQNNLNMVHLKCNCCDFYTNSIQKLSLHAQQMRHDSTRSIFQYFILNLSKNQEKFKEYNSVGSITLEDKISSIKLQCTLCSFKANNLLEIMQHIKTIQHLQMEQLVCMQRRFEKLDSVSLDQMFSVFQEFTEADIVKSEPLNQEYELKPHTSNSPMQIETSAASFQEDKKFYIEDSTSEAANETRDVIDFSKNAETDTSLIIFKCKHCDNFSQSKEEIVSHLEHLHTIEKKDDYISIPTNIAAIKAFQMAFVAARLAAEKRSLSPDTDIDSIKVKREKLSEEIVVGDTLDNDNEVTCPLCRELFSNRIILETHLIDTHTVKKENVHRLLQMIDDCGKPDDTSLNLEKSISPERNDSSKSFTLKCQNCDAAFKYEEQLLKHTQEMEHFMKIDSQYVCLAANNVFNKCNLTFPTINNLVNHYKDLHLKTIVSERHVYKYRCKQCSLAFKTQEKLSVHSLYHTIREATKCNECNRNFRSMQALQKHVELTHSVQVEYEGAKHCEETAEASLNATISETDEAQPRFKDLEPYTDPLVLEDKTNNFQNELQAVKMHPEEDIIFQNTQKECQESESFSAILPYSLQNLQNLQYMQSQISQINNSNISINTVEMLNLMQLQQIMSMNIMNLAPPLVLRPPASPVQEVSSNSINSDSQHDQNPNVTLPSMDVAPSIQQHSPTQLINHKRARTRITDEQLKILRAHFDINNSPSEESIMEMSQKSNLPMKVVKHWFRNTLFKERQRNKDSPYNFNNPPSTTLNLEEYEKTGQANTTINKKNIDTSSSRGQSPVLNPIQEFDRKGNFQTDETAPSRKNLNLVSGTTKDKDLTSEKKQTNTDVSTPSQNIHQSIELEDTTSTSPVYSKQQKSIIISNTMNSCETRSESGSSDLQSRPQSPNSISALQSFSNVSDIMGPQLDSLISNISNMGPPKKFQFCRTDKNLASQFETNSNSSNSSSTSGSKRANRTRFTDYQIKVLQEFFENNSYPKDSDLEYLSKLLLLSPRVIVVWFQNARQKQRKIYENQPNNIAFESEEKKQNINYTCKKCNLVFQRYYELIRHQKNHCFKEENSKKSAKAQIAAAQIAQNLSSEDSNSSLDILNNTFAKVASPSIGIQSIVSNASHSTFSKILSAEFSPSTTPTPPRCNSIENQLEIGRQKYECEKCKLCFSTFEHFREHQIAHIIHPNIFLCSQNRSDSCEISSFDNILQNLQDTVNPQHQQNNSYTLALPKRRKFSETSSNDDFSSMDATSIQSDETFHKKYELLLQYFLQNEDNSIVKQKFVSQKTILSDPESEIEFLQNYYRQCELKRCTNYEFLYQYFLKNGSADEKSNIEKPEMEFLLGYYQSNESKKFFHLEASSEKKLEMNNTKKNQLLCKSDSDKIEKLSKSDECLNEAISNEFNVDDNNSDKTNSTVGEKCFPKPPNEKSQEWLEQPEKEMKKTKISLLDKSKVSVVKSPKNSNEKLNKRLRTTILPDQLNILYECYQNESNPSRKMLEEIAKKVNLKKRVVQ